jgi:hypothetical protein
MGLSIGFAETNRCRVSDVVKTEYQVFFTDTFL